MPAGRLAGPTKGRVFVVMARDDKVEPRRRIGDVGLEAAPVVARDATLGPGGKASLDGGAISFPIETLGRLPAGTYYVQAVFDSNIDSRLVNAPGNLYSPVRKLDLDPRRTGTVALELDERVPDEALPPDTPLVRYVKIQSRLLSEFHHRPIFLRAGIILPPGYGRDPARRYPLRVHIGGYGARFTAVATMMAEGSAFRTFWLDERTPPMIFVHLDGDGPLGDPYQVNSANDGPYGDAVTQELIPFIEKTFLAVGRPEARFLDGGSTGGWVALALQIFYPDLFNGAWAGYPDPVDFRAYQLVDIYDDDNAYVNRHGFERPSARDPSGEVQFTMRHECRKENMLGPGDRYVLSGSPWGAWNAVYGPRGADGLPVPLWDPQTGAIDHAVAETWKRYDLRLILERGWATLGPKLQGKLHIWVGDADTYFLNNAVHLLDAFLSTAEPRYQGWILYGPGQPHGWAGVTDAQIQAQMTERH